MRRTGAILAIPRGLLRVFVFAGFCLVTLPVIASMPGSQRRYDLTRRWNRAVCAMLGLRVRKLGEPSDMRGAMIVCNHVSFLDIVILGGFLDAHFIAKAELASWPFFGFLARLCGTEFIVRDPRRAKDQRARLGARLKSGQSLILFPEGTTSDGFDLLPFKSTLFQAVLDAAEYGNRHIQPVTLAFDRRRDGLPQDAATRRHYSWPDDVSFPAHLWRILTLPGTTATLLFHAPIPVETGHCRKSVSQKAHAEIRAGLETLNLTEEG